MNEIGHGLDGNGWFIHFWLIPFYIFFFSFLLVRWTCNIQVQQYPVVCVHRCHIIVTEIKFHPNTRQIHVHVAAPKTIIQYAAPINWANRKFLSMIAIWRWKIVINHRNEVTFCCCCCCFCHQFYGMSKERSIADQTSQLISAKKKKIRRAR